MSDPQSSQSAPRSSTTVLLPALILILVAIGIAFAAQHFLETRQMERRMQEQKVQQLELQQRIEQLDADLKKSEAALKQAEVKDSDGRLKALHDEWARQDTELKAELEKLKSDIQSELKK